MRKDLEALQLEGREKLEIANNEFGLSYHTHTAPKGTKFLFYHEGQIPGSHPDANHHAARTYLKNLSK
ncbi:MAG: hypothetical protein IJU40_05980 [Desulfovibrionaceae bacterium]|nr:hypothetical protein [Desulfovibrionaceae bacterium]